MGAALKLRGRWLIFVLLCQPKDFSTTEDESVRLLAPDVEAEFSSKIVAALKG